MCVPALGRLGLLVLGVGLIADLIYHASPLTSASLFGTDGARPHLVVFVGMLVVVIGLIWQGLASSNARSVSERTHTVNAIR